MKEFSVSLRQTGRIWDASFAEGRLDGHLIFVQTG